MSQKKHSRIPRQSHHKGSGQAVVRLYGKDHYLGTFGSTKATAAYDALVNEWLANGRRLPEKKPTTTVNRVMLAYWRHCETHYRKPDGTATSELGLVKLALRPLKALYGRTEAAEFGPLKLKAVRQKMIDAGLSRSVINTHVGRVKRMFRWAVENELVPASVHHGLLAVRGLQFGRTMARESVPVRPIPQPLVDAVLPHVAARIAGMIQFQLLTGCRPGEACVIRGCDIDMAGSRWWPNVVQSPSGKCCPSPDFRLRRRVKPANSSLFGARALWD